jgi:hypothetical protein
MMSPQGLSAEPERMEHGSTLGLVAEKIGSAPAYSVASEAFAAGELGNGSGWDLTRLKAALRCFRENAPPHRSQF